MSISIQNLRIKSASWVLCLLLVGLFPNLAIAQFIPEQNRNRMACSDVRSLEAHVAALPSVAAIAAHRTNPVTPNCTWVQGTQFFTEREIGRPVGWLRAGNYIFLLHALTLEGKGYLHASVVLRHDHWRLNNGCGVSPYKVSLPTGESYRFFGRTKDGIQSHCLTLVNRGAEADRLNQPPVSYSDHWKSRPVERHMNVCRDLAGLTSGLDNVVNEQQIRNNSDDVFSRKQGCYQRGVGDLVASRFMGLYWSHPKPNKPEFWFEIYHVIYRNPTTGAVTSAYMPVNPIRNKLFDPSNVCVRSTANDPSQPRIANGVRLHGSQRGSVPGVTLPAEAGGIALPAISDTATGLDRCYIGRTFR